MGKAHWLRLFFHADALRTTLFGCPARESFPDPCLPFVALLFRLTTRGGRHLSPFNDPTYVMAEEPWSSDVSLLRKTKNQPKRKRKLTQIWKDEQMIRRRSGNRKDLGASRRKTKPKPIIDTPKTPTHVLEVWKLGL